jgi:hypothetical protein
VNLDTYESPDDLYRARGDDVNPNRPLFTGDVLRDVAIPGCQDGGMAIIIAHPCSFRVGDGKLAERTLASVVREEPRQGPGAWTRGFFDRMPLPDLDGPGFWACDLDLIGRADTEAFLRTERTACLSEVGINMLQQRQTCHMTRVRIPTHQFNQAFAHTYEEADLLEEWLDSLTLDGWSIADATAAFESFLRSSEPSLQQKLLDSQHRASVRRACSQEARCSTSSDCSAATRSSRWRTGWRRAAAATRSRD